MLSRFLFCLSLWLLGTVAQAHAELRLAVAANFADTLEALAADYQASTGDKVTVVRGSSGKLYAQIVQGAPFDIFFSADADRPKALEAKGLIATGSRQPYALGQLVLWPAGPTPEDALKAFAYGRFSIANPRLAPYGKAAMEVLTKLAILDKAQPRLVRGENISQAYQYVYSGNAEAGLLARSQMRNDDDFWEVPTNWYAPIEQQRVVMKNSKLQRAAEQFLAFMQTEAAEARILGAGYRLPGAH